MEWLPFPFYLYGFFRYIYKLLTIIIMKTFNILCLLSIVTYFSSCTVEPKYKIGTKVYGNPDIYIFYDTVSLNELKSLVKDEIEFKKIRNERNAVIARIKPNLRKAYTIDKEQFYKLGTSFLGTVIASETEQTIIDNSGIGTNRETIEITLNDKVKLNKENSEINKLSDLKEMYFKIASPNKYFVRVDFSQASLTEIENYK